MMNFGESKVMTKEYFEKHYPDVKNYLRCSVPANKVKINLLMFFNSIPFISLHIPDYEYKYIFLVDSGFPYAKDGDLIYKPLEPT